MEPSCNEHMMWLPVPTQQCFHGLCLRKVVYNRLPLACVPWPWQDLGRIPLINLLHSSNCCHQDPSFFNLDFQAIAITDLSHYRILFFQKFFLQFSFLNFWSWDYNLITTFLPFLPSKPSHIPSSLSFKFISPHICIYIFFILACMFSGMIIGTEQPVG